MAVGRDGAVSTTVLHFYALHQLLESILKRVGHVVCHPFLQSEPHSDTKHRDTVMKRVVTGRMQADSVRTYEVNNTARQ
jgi:hypothetical protein